MKNYVFLSTMAKKTDKKKPPEPKSIHEVCELVRICMLANGFKGASSPFQCNRDLFLRNLKIEEKDGLCVLSFDVDYDNGQNVVSKHLEARYMLSNYRNVVRDIKKMLSQADELCKTVFVGDTFKDRMFMMMRLDLSGWQVIR